MNPHQTTILFNREFGSAWTFHCGYCDEVFRIVSRGLLKETDAFRHECPIKSVEMVMHPPVVEWEAMVEEEDENDDFNLALREAVLNEVKQPVQNAASNRPEDPYG